MTSVADRIMDNQNSERLWLPVRPEVDAYLAEVAAHAIRPMDQFPPYDGEPERSEEVVEIDRQIAALQQQRSQLVGEVPGEVIIRGIRTRRRKDGSVPFTLAIKGVIGPVANLDSIPVALQSIWLMEPTGDDSHQVMLGAVFSAGVLGEQKLRMYLDFIMRRDPEDDNDDNETNWDDYSENVEDSGDYSR